MLVSCGKGNADSSGRCFQTSVLHSRPLRGCCCRFARADAKCPDGVLRYGARPVCTTPSAAVAAHHPASSMESQQ